MNSFITFILGLFTAFFIIFLYFIFQDNKLLFKRKKIKNKKITFLEKTPKHTLFINTFQQLKKYSYNSVFIFNGVKIYQKNDYFSLHDLGDGEVFYFYDKEDNRYELKRPYYLKDKIHLKKYDKNNNLISSFQNINLSIILN